MIFPKRFDKLSTPLLYKPVKPALILGGIYYIAIPIISTFLADKFDRKNLMKEGNNELFGDKITRS